MVRHAQPLEEMVWPSVRSGAVVYVPVGSTEQHGPHLPLSTDTVVATAVARELSMDDGGLLAPAISVGASGEHQDFPGTISIGTDALRLVIVELVRSLSLWAGRVVLVNGHGGNLSAVRGAMGQLLTEGHAVNWVPCAAGGDAHAGHTETSLLLYLAPWLVDPGRIETGNTAPLQLLMPDLVSHGVRAVAPNGVLGDPLTATAAYGEHLFRQMVQRARDAL